MNTVNWFAYGVEMATAFCEGTSTYTQCGSQYIAEYEGISGTASETEFCKGWQTIVSLTGDVEMHQALIRMKEGKRYKEEVKCL